MGKFKVGDRVRRITRDNPGSKTRMNVGDEGEVIALDTIDWISVAGYEKLGGQNPIYFELVSPEPAPSPIRTITRREIVPGVYGIVDVGSVGISGAKVPVVVDEGFVTAPDLRAAATLFNELADVLDENAGVR